MSDYKLGIVVPVLGDSVTETIMFVLNSLLLKVTKSIDENAIDAIDKSKYLKLIMDEYKINYNCSLTDAEWDSIVNAAKQLTEDTNQQFRYIYNMLRLYCANGYVNSRQEIKADDSIHIEYKIDLPALTGIRIENLDGLFERVGNGNVTVNITFVVPYEFNHEDICKRFVKITENDVIVAYHVLLDNYYTEWDNITIKSDSDEHSKISIHICKVPHVCNASICEVPDIYKVKDIAYNAYEYIGLKHAIKICEYVTVVNVYNNAIVPIYDMTEIIRDECDRYKYTSTGENDFDKFIIKSSILDCIVYDDMYIKYYFEEPKIITDIVIIRLHNDVLKHDVQKQNEHVPKVGKDAKLGVIVPAESRNDIIPTVLGMICDVNIAISNDLKNELNELLDESTCFIILDSIASEFEISIQRRYASMCRNLYRYCIKNNLDYIDKIQSIVQYEYIKQAVEKYSEDENRYTDLLNECKNIKGTIEKYSKYKKRYAILYNRYEHIKQALGILNSKYGKQYNDLLNECENTKRKVEILNSEDIKRYTDSINDFEPLIPNAEKQYNDLLGEFEEIEQGVEILNSKDIKRYSDLLNECKNIELCSKLDIKTILLINLDNSYGFNTDSVCRYLADITGNSVLAYYRDEIQTKTCYLPTTDEQKTQIHIELILDSHSYIALANNLLTNRNRFDYVANYNMENAFPFKLVDIFAELNGNAKIMQFLAINENENSSFIISNELIPESIIIQSNDNVITRNIEFDKHKVKILDVPYIFALSNANDKNVVDKYKVSFEPSSNTTYSESIKAQGGYKNTNLWLVLCMILVAAIVVYLIARICIVCMCKQACVNKHKQCM